MIIGKMHKGSGLGNQLHSYLATRILALDKGFDFGIAGKEYFKGKEFMNLDMGRDFSFPICLEWPAGKIVMESPWPLFEEKTNYYNPEINFVADDTIIDGYWQDERYFEHRLTEVNEWLKVEHLSIPSDVCVIGFRGGEFYVFPELGLPKEYYEKGISMMKEINPDMKFEVHTDDVALAKQFFPDYKIIHDVGINWRSVRYAQYAIIANSSFYILPRLLAHHFDYQDNIDVTIAPRGWARRNIKEWSMPANFYKSFHYI